MSDPRGMTVDSAAPTGGGLRRPQTGPDLRTPTSQSTADPDSSPSSSNSTGATFTTNLPDDFTRDQAKLNRLSVPELRVGNAPLAPSIIATANTDHDAMQVLHQYRLVRKLHDDEDIWLVQRANDETEFVGWRWDIPRLNPAFGQLLERGAGNAVAAVLNHPNLVSHVDIHQVSYWRGRDIEYRDYAISDYMDAGTLRNFIDKTPVLPKINLRTGRVLQWLPESLAQGQRPYFKGTEVFKVGVILWQMMTRQLIPDPEVCIYCQKNHWTEGESETEKLSSDPSTSGEGLAGHNEAKRQCKGWRMGVFRLEEWLKWLSKGADCTQPDAGYSPGLISLMSQLLDPQSFRRTVSTFDLLDGAKSGYLEWKETTEEGKRYIDQWDDLVQREKNRQKKEAHERDLALKQSGDRAQDYVHLAMGGVRSVRR